MIQVFWIECVLYVYTSPCCYLASSPIIHHNPDANRTIVPAFTIGNGTSWSVLITVKWQINYCCVDAKISSQLLLSIVRCSNIVEGHSEWDGACIKDVLLFPLGVIFVSLAFVNTNCCQFLFASLYTVSTELKTDLQPQDIQELEACHYPSLKHSSWTSHSI